MKSRAIIPVADIKDRIFTFRSIQAMLDRDLADVYQVPVKRLNEQVKRNKDRFPEKFCFQLDDAEKKELVANCDRLSSLKHSSVNPYAFTEQGVAMLSAVLRSDTAVKVSVQIMDAFVEMRKLVLHNAALFHRLENVEKKQREADEKIESIFGAIESGEVQPLQGVFYNGQVFDAYKFVSKLIRSAKTSIVLIDSYIDDTVLTHFEKRRAGVTLTILTRKPSKQLKLDVKKFSEQYPDVILKSFTKAHDRFLIIDDTVLYHFGASLKDLGKKWFAFSRMDMETVGILDKIWGMV